MMPEVSLMAVLVIVFIADFFTAPRVADVQAGADFKAPRAWFGPQLCCAHVLPPIRLVLGSRIQASTTKFEQMFDIGLNRGRAPRVSRHDMPGTSAPHG